MTQRLVILVNHLLGAGHLARALTLGRAFAGAGWDAHVISGGFPVPQFDSTGVHLHQLPPIRSDGADFSRLLSLDGQLVDDTLFAARVAAARDVLTAVQPDVLMLELFPFGRRNLRQEYAAILDTAVSLRPKPKIVSSIRDILSPPSKPRKLAFAEDVLEQYVAAVFVHADPHVIPLEQSWPVSDAVRQKLTYTGFVAPALPPKSGDAAADEILVSTGSGAIGDQVFNAALEAARDGGMWRCLVGGPDPDRARKLAARAGPNVTVERARPDFRSLLQTAKASVSLCGYNTSMDVLQSGVPAVIVPYDEGTETEQRLRAEALVKMPQITSVSLNQIDGARLSAALQAALSEPLRDSGSIRFDGATETVRLCGAILKGP